MPTRVSFGARKIQSAWSAFGAALMATFLIFATAGNGPAHACPPGQDGGAAIGVTLMDMDAADFQAFLSSTPSYAPVAGTCRTGAIYSGGAGCCASPCSACSAVLPVLMADMNFGNKAIGQAPPDDNGLAPARPDAEFPPPRFTV